MELEKDDEKVHLEKIPSSFSDFAGNEEVEYVLLGVIKNVNNVLESKSKKRKVGKNATSQSIMGHYTAVCKRNNSWVQIDDLSGLQTNLKSEAAKKIFIGLIVYAKISKL